MPDATIGQVLRRPSVAATLAASIIARLPYGAISLLTILLLTDAGYSYAQAGVAAGASAIAGGIALPALSRLVDRRGQTRVLLVTAVTGAATSVVLALAPSSTPLAGLVVLAALNGAAQPPISGIMRALWDQMVDTDGERHVGYSLDAVAVESVFTGGPLVLVGVVAAATGPQGGLLTAAALTLGGTLILASMPPSRQWQPSRQDHPSLLGALRAPGVRTLMFAALGAGASFGMIELASSAYGRAHGSLSLTGLLLGGWSIGSMLGGLAIARGRAPRSAVHRLTATLAAMAAGDLLIGLAGTPWLLGLLMFIAGAGIAPTMATANGAMSVAAPTGMLTEAYAWFVGAVLAGVTIGSPIAGLIVDASSPAVAYSASAVPPALAAAIVWWQRATLQPAAAEPAHTGA